MCACVIRIVNQIYINFLRSKSISRKFHFQHRINHYLNCFLFFISNKKANRIKKIFGKTEEPRHNYKFQTETKIIHTSDINFLIISEIFAITINHGNYLEKQNWENVAKIENSIIQCCIPATKCLKAVLVEWLNSFLIFSIFTDFDLKQFVKSKIMVKRISPIGISIKNCSILSTPDIVAKALKWWWLAIVIIEQSSNAINPNRKAHWERNCGIIIKLILKNY